MEVLLSRLIESLLFPPGLMIILMLAGTIVMRKRYTLGRNIIIGGFALLLLASMRITPQLALSLIETTPALTIADLQNSKADAIVILGGGRYAEAPEYHRDTVSGASLQRLRYGAYLHKQTNLPILVTGGSPFGNKEGEAVLMQRALQDSFSINTLWLETNSDNTKQNADKSYALLKKENIKNIYLVTHAWHMPRAKMVFAQAGFNVIPAPTGFTSLIRGRPWLLNITPDPAALTHSKLFLHEALGIVWYKLRY